MDRNKKEKRRPWPTASRELDFPAVLSLPDGSSRGCHKNTASEIRFIGKKTMQQVKVVMPIENLYVRATARTRPGNDVGKPVAVHIARGHSNATGEGCIKRKEAQQDCVRSPVKDFHVWSAARTGAGNDVGCRVAVNVTGSPIYTATIRSRELPYAAHFPSAYSVKHPYMRPPAGPGSGDDVSKAIAVDIANSHTNAAGKTSSIGRKGKRIIPGLAVNCDLLHDGRMARVRANGQNR